MQQSRVVFSLKINTVFFINVLIFCVEDRSDFSTLREHSRKETSNQKQSELLPRHLTDTWRSGEEEKSFLLPVSCTLIMYKNKEDAYFS